MGAASHRLSRDLGNSAPFVLEVPGYNNQNISIAKSFAITERLPHAPRRRRMPSIIRTSICLRRTSRPRQRRKISSMMDGSANRRIEQTVVLIL
jgi:hypothetical protein